MQKLFNQAAGNYATEDINKTTKAVDKWLSEATSGTGEITIENIGGLSVGDEDEATKQAKQNIIDQKQQEFMDLYNETVAEDGSDKMTEFNLGKFEELSKDQKAYFNAYSESTSTFAKNLSKRKFKGDNATQWDANERKAVLEAYEHISENAIQGAGQIRDIMTEAAEASDATSKAIVQAGLAALETSNYNNQA
jgi:alpha-amylase/alpha-mannosidase (GH57 family)